jgi:choline dehydrogenase-like flavoprotein
MERYDVIVIGTGAGGGTLLHKLAPTGKRILVLERGGFLPREKENWNTVEVFQKDRYHTHEVWKDGHGKDIHPGTGYWVGGNTKVYGAALLRMREKDFGRLEHKGGVSPEWPLRYADFERFYTEAERIYGVHGKRGVDPTEPPMSAEYPFAPVSHEPRIQEAHDAFVSQGLHPFQVPIGVRLNVPHPAWGAPCIRCSTCDGFPCLMDAKSDSDVACVRPSLAHTNVTLLTGAKVLRLVATGGSVKQVEVELDGKVATFGADVVAVCAGAINSALLLERSNLGNASGQLGRNLMKHNNGAILAVSTKPNPTVFQKTLAVHDFYFGEPDFPFPMGHVSLTGKANKDMLTGDAPGFTPEMALDQMAKHSVDWWLTSEDLPAPENRVRYVNNEITLEYTDNNLEAYHRLIDRWVQVLKKANMGDQIFPNSLYLRKKIPVQGVAHQCGTTRFGSDPKGSVLDLDCKVHDLDNLYVVDGGFFPSSAAVNPSLTIMANALRVGEHLNKRLGS